MAGDWDLGRWDLPGWIGGKDARFYASLERFQPYDLDQLIGLPFGLDDEANSPQTTLSAGYLAPLKDGNARLGLGAGSACAIICASVPRSGRRRRAWTAYSSAASGSIGISAPTSPPTRPIGRPAAPGRSTPISNVAVALGGGAAYDPVKDEWIAPKYTIGGTDYSNVGDALAAVGGTAGAGWSLSAQGANASNVAPGETVDLRSGDGNIVVSKAETGDTVSFDLADDLDVSESITVGADPADPNAPTTVITGGSIVIGGTMLGSNGLVITGGPSVTTDGIDAGGMKVTNVANGTVAKDSKDAVNGGQLFDVVANATANGVGYDDKSKGTLTLEGADGTKITNVAAGDLNANSTDAVNGSQLYATNVKVDRLDTEVKEIDSRVTYIESFQGDLENAAVYDTDAAGKRLNTLTLEGGDPNKPVLIANVAKGVKATDAVNVGQLDESVAESKSYTDEKTEWAIDQAAIYTDQVVETKVSAVNNYAQQRFAQLSGEIGQVRGEARQAAAIGLAAASLRFDNEPGKLSVALGGGFWRSEGALAFGAGYTSEDGRVRANLTGAAAGGNVGVGAGLSITLN